MTDPSNKALTREDIVGAKDILPRRVDVPEWGGYVFLRQQTGDERDAFEAEQHARNKQEEQATTAGRATARSLFMREFRARYLQLCLCDEAGTLLFAGAEGAKALGAKSVRSLDRLFALASKMNGLTKEDIAELVGNSGGGPSAASGTA